MGQYVLLNYEGRGLDAFPTLNNKETCVKLKGNVIDHFPNDISNLVTVVTLDLSENRVSAIPNDLDTLSNLEILDISGNRLQTLSPQTRFPASLRGLILANNQMKILPPAIKVPGLFVLDLSNNMFADIPEHFCVSDQLIRIDFTNNPLQHDVSHYIDTVNRCRNANNIQFCLFIDKSNIRCDCSSVGPILTGTPSFCMGTQIRGREIQCTTTDSEEVYSGKYLFDVNDTMVKEACPLALDDEIQNKNEDETSGGPNFRKNDLLRLLTLIQFVFSCQLLI